MSRPLATLVLAAAAIVGFANAATAQTFAPIYGIRHTNRPELWSIDLATGKATFVSNSMRRSKVACARHPRTGQIWLFSNVTPNKISVWDPATDTETTIFDGPNVQFHRVGFDADCNLYGVPLNSNVLFKIDTTTGALTNLGGMAGVNTGGDGGDLAFAPGETRKFTYFSSARLYEIDVATLKSTLLNNDVGFKTTGAAYTADGRLWVSSDYDLYSCDPATGAMTLVGSFGMKQILDLTEDLSPMYFGVSPLDAVANQQVNLFTREGAANAPLLLVATDVSGTPMFLPLGLYAFDASGQWSSGGVVPPGLSGATLTLETIGFTTNGDLMITNSQTLAFQ